MSPARTLLNTKYDLGENRTHDTSFVGYIALYTLSRKETTHSGSSYDWAKALEGGHEKSIVRKKFNANLEMLSLSYSFKLYMCQDPRIARAYTAQNTKKAHFPLVSLSVYPRSSQGAERIRHGEGRWSRPPKTALERSYLTENSRSQTSSKTNGLTRIPVPRIADVKQNKRSRLCHRKIQNITIATNYRFEIMPIL